MTVTRANTFKRAYQRLDPQQRERVKAAIALFLVKPHPPRPPEQRNLRIRKMSGYTDIWEMRASDSLRITFNLEEDEVILRKCGEHDILNNP